MKVEERISLRDRLITIFLNNSLIVLNNNGSTYRIKRINKLKAFANNNSEVKELYESYVNDFNSEEEALFCLRTLDDLSNHVCKYCNKRICKYVESNHEYRGYCGSEECLQRLRCDAELIERRKATNLKKYGVDNPAKSSTVQDKIKQTNLERYGVANTFQVEEFKEKGRQTNLERYGCKYVMQSEEIREKSRESCMEKYGVENVSQAESIKDKKKATTLEHYGVENPFQSEEIKEKSKATNLENLGVEYAMQSEEVREKSKATNLNRLGVEWPMQSEEVRRKSMESRKK